METEIQEVDKMAKNMDNKNKSTNRQQNCYDKSSQNQSQNKQQNSFEKNSSKTDKYSGEDEH